MDQQILNDETCSGIYSRELIYYDNMIRQIRYDDFVDTRSLQDITQQIRDFEADSFNEFIDVLPPVRDLIKSIPRTLPLLDAIYTKCDTFEDKYPHVFKNELECDSVINRIIWWMAQMNQIGTIPTRNDKNWTSPRGNAFQFSILKSHIKSILCVLQRNNPDIIKEIIVEKNQLNSALEALGCHGLVNCNTGMIRLIDATVIETVRYYEKLKQILSRLKDIQKHKFAFLDETPIKASHQRQLNLKLSEIFDRLKQNEIIDAILEDLLSNQHLTSLHRIVKKRVRADRQLVNIFNSYNNTKPDGFQICEVNPIIAKIIVIFKNAYVQLTTLMPTIENGLAIVYNNNDQFNVEDVHTDESETQSSSSKKKEYINDDNQIKANKENNWSSSSNDDSCFNESSDISTNTVPEDARWITLSIYSSYLEIESIVEKYSNLFYMDRLEILNSLNQLKEFKDKIDLQHKTILSVIILTYRTVYDKTQEQYKVIYDTLGCTTSDIIMDFSIYRLLYRQAKSDNGMSIARDITVKIWDTLYDFPSLKTCTRFNRFILDCVDIIWDIVAGIDGRLPRIKIYHDNNGIFDDNKHIRYDKSKNNSNLIKQCLWPGLITLQDDNYIFKSVVIT